MRWRPRHFGRCIPWHDMARRVVANVCVGKIRCYSWQIAREKTKGTDTLSDKAVKSFKPKDAPYKKSDGKGLYLLVQPAGGKLCRWPTGSWASRKHSAS